MFCCLRVWCFMCWLISLREWVHAPIPDPDRLCSSDPDPDRLCSSDPKSCADSIASAFRTSANGQVSAVRPTTFFFRRLRDNFFFFMHNVDCAHGAVRCNRGNWRSFVSCEKRWKCHNHDDKRVLV
jgi:hypothetical protein